MLLFCRWKDNETSLTLLRKRSTKKKRMPTVRQKNNDMRLILEMKTTKEKENIYTVLYVEG